MASDEAAYAYHYPRAWSALRNDPDFGLRIRAKPPELGRELAHQRLTEAAHILSEMGRFGERTMNMGRDLIEVLQGHGIEVVRTP